MVCPLQTIVARSEVILEDFSGARVGPQKPGVTASQLRLGELAVESQPYQRVWLQPATPLDSVAKRRFECFQKLQLRHQPKLRWLVQYQSRVHICLLTFRGLLKFWLSRQAGREKPLGRMEQRY